MGAVRPAPPLRPLDVVRVSKRLSFALRHRPDALGLVLDPHGWVDVDALLAALASSGHPLTREQLHRVVAENDKQRFELRAGQIRAQQGHSVDVDLDLQPLTPPPVLWHGTVERAVEPILREGLRPGRRRHVHLSPDLETATRVGSRRGRPVVLTVDATAACAGGVRFFLSGNGVWLADSVPPEHVRRSDPTGDRLQVRWHSVDAEP